MRKTVMLIAALAAVSTAEAQVDPRPDSEACAEPTVTGMYRRCALAMEGHVVRRGQEGVIVARPGFFRPLQLAKVVTGDSAQAFARMFDRRSRQAGFLGLVGGGLLGASLSGRCGLSAGACASGGETSIALLLGGTAATVAAVVIQGRATRAGARAIWWHNERFAR